MSFLDNIKDNRLKKIVLVEISKGYTPPLNEWVEYSPGLWKFRYHNINSTGTTQSYSAGYGPAGLLPAGGSGSVYVNPIRNRIRINSIFATGRQFVTVDSLANVVINEKSFFWDESEQTIYVHFSDNLSPYDQDFIIIGIVEGFCSNGESNYFDDIFYDGRVLSVSNLSRKSDPLFWGVSSVSDARITLENSDNYFSDFGEYDVYGQKIQIKVGTENMAYSDYVVRYTGFLDKYTFSEKTINITAVTDKSLFKMKIGTTILSVDDYPYLDPRNEGKAIPMGFGDITRQEAICLNELEPLATSFTFAFCDPNFRTKAGSVAASTNIEAVYIDGIEVSTETEDLSNGLFTISSSDYQKGKKVYVSYSGYSRFSTRDPVTLISDLLFYFNDIKFNNFYYDTSNWTSSGVSLSYSIGSGQETIERIIEAMGRTSYGFMDILPDGRYAFRKSRRSNSATKNIHYYDLLTYPEETDRGDYFLTSAKVGYKRDYESKDYRYVYNKEKESDLYTEFKKYKDKSFETDLLSKFYADLRAEKIIEDFGGSFPFFEIYTSYELYNLNLLENVIAEIKAINIKNEEWGKIKAEVISIEENLNNFTIKITLRYIEEATEFI